MKRENHDPDGVFLVRNLRMLTCYSMYNPVVVLRERGRHSREAWGSTERSVWVPWWTVDPRRDSGPREQGGVDQGEEGSDDIYSHTNPSEDPTCRDSETDQVRPDTSSGVERGIQVQTRDLRPGRVPRRVPTTRRNHIPYPTHSTEESQLRRVEELTTWVKVTVKETDFNVKGSLWRTSTDPTGQDFNGFFSFITLLIPFDIRLTFTT